MHRSLAIAGLATFGLCMAGPGMAQFRLNEIRMDQAGVDSDEFVELSGPPGASLAGLHLLVIGDSFDAHCGNLETLIDLGSYSIQADGLFALRYSQGAAQLTGYDASLTGSFENSDHLTFLLVTGSTGVVGSDLDLFDDGVLDSTPWTSIVDQLAIENQDLPDCFAGIERVYAFPKVGSDRALVPGHVYRCGNNWLVGEFDAASAAATDTPGGPNIDCPVPIDTTTWSRLKTRWSD